MQRIGVFVCHCGSNIAATVDVKKVVEMALQESGVFHAEDYPYMCSEAGQIPNRRRNQGKGSYRHCGLLLLPPDARDDLPQGCGSSRDQLPIMVEIANIREHCSWIHKDMEDRPPGKAVILMRAAVAKVHLNAPLTAGRKPGHKAGAGHRRRYRRDPDRAGYRRRGLQGGYCGDNRPPSVASMSAAG